MSTSDLIDNTAQAALPPKLPPRAISANFGPETSTPALPDRAKSADQLSLDASKPVAVVTKRTSNSNPSIGEHYAHLSKHVKEVRRRKPKNTLETPRLSDFQKKQTNDTVSSTNWIEFIKAWIKYIISSAAYDEVDRPLEPFSLGTIKHDVDRLFPMVAPFLELAKKIQHIYRWENKTLTGSIATLYVFLWYFDLILAFLIISATVSVCWFRVDTFAQYGVDALEEHPETDATVKTWNRSFWMKMRTSMGTRSSYGFNLFDDISMSELSEWRNDLYKNYGPTIQLMLSDTVDYLERIKNLVTWKRPNKTRFLVVMLVSSIIFLTFLPLRLIVKTGFLYIGFEFFVLQALRSYYPRHRRLFNILNLLLWGVPNDAEYALEVVRLSDYSKESNQESSSREGSSKLRQRKAITCIDNNDPPKPFPPKLSASMSDIASTLTEASLNHNKPRNTKPTFQEQAASTAGTLAMLAAAAAVNKVKKTVDNQKDKKKEPEELASDNESNAYGCIYKGNIPGRIIISSNEFTFKTSRMTGSKILVECAFADIVGVKKTKQFDMLVWHANGIDVSMVDGGVLKFENVLRRDECFNRLISASGEEGGEWKKM